MRGATNIVIRTIRHYRISIHTPHAGSDLAGQGHGVDVAHISIHTPHAGSDFIAVSAPKSPA